MWRQRVEHCPADDPSVVGGRRHGDLKVVGLTGDVAQIADASTWPRSHRLDAVAVNVAVSGVPNSQEAGLAAGF